MCWRLWDEVRLRPASASRGIDVRLLSPAWSSVGGAKQRGTCGCRDRVVPAERARLIDRHPELLDDGDAVGIFGDVRLWDRPRSTSVRW